MKPSHNGSVVDGEVLSWDSGGINTTGIVPRDVQNRRYLDRRDHISDRTPTQRFFLAKLRDFATKAAASSYYRSNYLKQEQQTSAVVAAIEDAATEFSKLKSRTSKLYFDNYRTEIEP